MKLNTSPGILESLSPLLSKSCRERGRNVSVDDDIQQVLEICKGDYKAALRMVVVANAFYEAEIRLLKEEASAGYGRGRVRKPKAS